MKSILFILLLGASGTLFSIVKPSPAGADLFRDMSKCAVLIELAKFVSSETDYPPLTNCPMVSLATSSALRGFLGVDTNYDQEQPMAMYMPMGAEILISPEVDVSSALGQSYLVHELVHAHQYEYGMAGSAPCLGWLEGEAYRIQASYLKTRGLAKDAFEMEMLGLLQSSCGQAYHPDLIP